MDQDGPRTDVEVLLGGMEQHILGLHSRHRFLVGFETELRAATRDKCFAVWNLPVWLMILDHRDMLVSDLASFARATYGEDGSLSRLHSAAAACFRRRRMRAEDEPSFSGRMLDALHTSAFIRLFPACAQRHAAASDFDGLASWYFDVARPMLIVRDPNRSEALERTGSADKLNLAGIAAFIDTSERMINDLRHVSLGNTVGFLAEASQGEHEAQTELVDMLLHGSLARASQLAGNRSRDALYSALHLAHEKLPED